MFFFLLLLHFNFLINEYTAESSRPSFSRKCISQIAFFFPSSPHNALWVFQITILNGKSARIGTARGCFQKAK